MAGTIKLPNQPFPMLPSHAFYVVEGQVMGPHHVDSAHADPFMHQKRATFSLVGRPSGCDAHVPGTSDQLASDMFNTVNTLALRGATRSSSVVGQWIAGVKSHLAH